MNIRLYIKRGMEYIKKGGATYANITYTSSDESLKGKKIIITGGSSGIGKAIAKKCINSGAEVVITGRNKEKLITAKNELGFGCHILIHEMSCIDESADLIERAEKLFNAKPDCLVNNAGVYVNKRFKDFNADDYNNILNTNLRGAYFLTQKFINYSITNNIQSNILMVISNRGLMGDTSPYGISKKALISYTEGLARDYIRNGIRVNGICPGMTATNINGIKDMDNLFNDTRGKRILLSEEIAELCKFLLSDVSKCVVGAIIPCDEGDHIR